MQKKILMAEDHPLLRRSIRAICDSVDLSELREVGTCRELVHELKRDTYTHLILDLTLADGNALDLLEDIFHNYCNLRILVYSSMPAGIYGASFRRQYGIQYISKSEPAPDTVQQLLDFLQNNRPAKARAFDAEHNSFSIVTQREMQILNYLLLGWSAQQIGDKLDISPATVRVQKKNILEKTKTANLIELKELARLHNII